MAFEKKLTALLLPIWLVCFSCAAPKVVTPEKSVLDIIGPKIEHDSDEVGVAGDTQLFTVVVTDNIGVAQVRLSHRFSGEEAFSTGIMTSVGADNYQSNVESKPFHSAIEYFITAKDNSGLEVFRGSPDAPLTRQLEARVSVIEQPEIQYPPMQASLKMPLSAPDGLLVSGILATFADSGGINGIAPCPSSICGVFVDKSRP